MLLTARPSAGPPANASAQVLYDYLDKVNTSVVKTWSDRTLTYYQAYYQQSANQLGYPAFKESHLVGLAYPGQDLPAIYPPVDASKTYDGGVAMRDIQTWMNTSAAQVILVYGENDPWTAGALEVPSAAEARGVRKFIAPNGNHGSSLATLTSTDRSQAYALLSQWMNAPVNPAAHPRRVGRGRMNEGTQYMRKSTPEDRRRHAVSSRRRSAERSDR